MKRVYLEWNYTIVCWVSAISGGALLVIDANADFSEVAAGGDVFEGLAGFGEGEDFVDDGPKFVLLDRAVHFLESLAGADEDALNADVLHEDECEVEGSLWTGEDADEANVATHFAGTDGLIEGAYAADFDDVVCAHPSGLLLDFFGPLFVFAVVNTVGCAKFGGALEFFVAAGGDDDLCAGELGELEREDGHAAGAEGEHGVAWADAAVAEEAAPCSEARTGEGRAFFVAQVVGKFHSAVFFEDDELGEHAVERTAHGGGVDAVGHGFPGVPVLEETTRDAIADGELIDAFTYFDDLTRAIGKRDNGEGLSWIVVALDEE